MSWCTYDALIERPEDTLVALNEFLQTTLQLDDLRAVYSGTLHRPTRGLPDWCKARLIYAKNFLSRVR